MDRHDDTKSHFAILWMHLKTAVTAFQGQTCHNFIFACNFDTTSTHINTDKDQLNTFTSDIFHAIPENSRQHLGITGPVINISNIYTIRF